MKLIGQGNVYNGKSYSLSDSVLSTVPSVLGFDDTWYGGMVKRLYLTKDGVYMCCDGKENIVNILVPDTTPEVTESPTNDFDIKVDVVVDTDKKKLSRHEIIELAKQLNVEGKIATMKTDDLIDAIKEKGGVIDGM